jgi:UDP-GlcNAc:undecaprenyl-phosphate/decaprenyl-phosphate GlcNAc-1-phosphate transferase
MTNGFHTFLNSGSLITIAPSLVAFIVSLVVTGVMVKVGVPDVPDYRRKQHRVPNPTAGGVGILAGMVAAGFVSQIYLGIITSFSAPVTLWMWIQIILTGPFYFLIPILAGCIGFADDVRDLKPHVKLLLLVLLSSSSIYQFGWVEEILFAAGTSLVLPAFLGILGTLLWYLVITNTVNFMDGSNGLAMTCAAVGLVGIAIVLTASATGTFLDFSTIMGGGSIWWVVSAIIGFLFWNAPNGKIFAGDTGAIAVGMTIAWISVGATEKIGVFPIVICFLPMLVDAILTVVWRITKRQQLTTAHAHHAYQVLLRAGLSHGKVAVIYCCLTFACVVAGYFGVATADGTTREDIWLGSVIAFLGMLTFLSVCYAFVRAFATRNSLNHG